MVGHGGSSAGSYLADPTSPIPSHCASIVVTSTLRVKTNNYIPASRVMGVNDKFMSNTKKMELMSDEMLGAMSCRLLDRALDYKDQ